MLQVVILGSGIHFNEYLNMQKQNLGTIRIDGIYIYIIYYFGLFRTAPSAYGSFQTRGQTRAAAASLHHSSQQRRILNPLSEARDRTHVLMDPSQVHYCSATVGTPKNTAFSMSLSDYPISLSDFFERSPCSRVEKVGSIVTTSPIK